MPTIFEYVPDEQTPSGIEVRSLHPWSGFAITASKHPGVTFCELRRFAEARFDGATVHDQRDSAYMLSQLCIEARIACCVVTMSDATLRKTHIMATEVA